MAGHRYIIAVHLSNLINQKKMKRLLFLIALITMGLIPANENNSAPTRRSEMASTLSGN